MENLKDKPEWPIGTIVVLKTHFYSNLDDKDLVMVSGEPQLISPLMIITEAMKETRSSYEENSGIEVSVKGSYQYKCMWFSQKSYQFEEAWLSSRLLTQIKIFENDANMLKEVKKYGAFVEFRTCEIELGKKKTTFKKINDNPQNSNFTQTSLLSFVSPIMQVIGTGKNEIKDSLFNPKTNEQTRFISRALVKCKYFNSASDKLSEVFIPIEALNVLPDISNTKLPKIKLAIQNNKYIIIKTSKDVHAKTILKPIRIDYRNGRFYLFAYDYVLNKNIEQNINEIEMISDNKDNYFSEMLPTFNVGRGNRGLVINLVKKDNLESLFRSIGKNKFIYIQYKDINEILTKRTIKDYEFIDSDETTEGNEVIKISYVKAFCLLRNAIRYFRIDRIKELKVLDFD